MSFTGIPNISQNNPSVVSEFPLVGLVSMYENPLLLVYTWPVFFSETEVNFEINTSVYIVHDSCYKLCLSMSVWYRLVSGTMADCTDNCVVAVILLTVVFLPIVYF